MSGTLSEHSSAVQCDVLFLVASDQDEKDLRFDENVFHCGESLADLPSQDVVEDERDVFLALEINFLKALDQQ